MLSQEVAQAPVLVVAEKEEEEAALEQT